MEVVHIKAIGSRYSLLARSQYLDGWMTCNLCPFQQYFSHMRAKGDYWLFIGSSILSKTRFLHVIILIPIPNKQT